MEEKIIEIIENITGYNNLKENKEIDLLENEIIDSLAFIELISSIENEFDIEIQPTQIDPNTWRKVSSIVSLIEQLKNRKNTIRLKK